MDGAPGGGNGVQVCGQEDRDGDVPAVLKVVNAQLYPQFLHLAEFHLSQHDPVPAVDALGRPRNEPKPSPDLDLVGQALQAWSPFDPNLTLLPGKGAATIELPYGTRTTGARVEPAALAMVFTVILDVLSTVYAPVNYLVELLDCVRRTPEARSWSGDAVDAWTACAGVVSTGLDEIARESDVPRPPEEGESRIPTARCADGRLSYATGPQGRCSHHGGVVRTWEPASRAQELGDVAGKLLDGLSNGLRDAPAVLQLLTKGAKQGPFSLQVVAKPKLWGRGHRGLWRSIGHRPGWGVVGESAAVILSLCRLPPSLLDRSRS